MKLQDQYKRQHRKLRVSLTDRCNFRCPYCMPEKPRWMPAPHLLEREELIRLLRLFVAEMGIECIRLTGGEPLLRRDLLEIIRDLQPLREMGLKRISMTSNGVRLSTQAQALAQAGLDDINISLDSLEPDQFQRLSRGRYGLADVLTGIDAARDAGLPVKLNSVIIRDYNDDQILPLLRWAGTQQLELRYIEFMPLDDEDMWSRERVISAAQILARIQSSEPVHALPASADPARRYQLSGGQHFGIIATVSQPFCRRCDRLRITADGRLYTCLFGKEGTLLKGHIDDPEALKKIIAAAVLRKPPGYIEQAGYAEREVRMYHLGG